MQKLICFLLGHNWTPWRLEAMESRPGYSHECRRCGLYRWLSYVEHNIDFSNGGRQ